MNKKKLPFIQLAAIFGLITLIALFYSWGSSPNTMSSPSMMEQSMGSMMKMHLENVTVAELVKQKQPVQAAQVGDDAASHHNEQYSFLKIMHFLTTATIVILLPFIIAGAVFLGIIWLR